jgi:hypothetical protein
MPREKHPAVGVMAVETALANGSPQSAHDVNKDKQNLQA